MTKQTGTNDNDPGEDLAAVKKDVEALRGDLAALVKSIKGLGEKKASGASSDLAALLETVKEIGEGKLGSAGTAGSEAVDALRAALEGNADRLRRQGQASVAEVERAIQDRPLMALLAAFGVGLLFARFWDRR